VNHDTVLLEELGPDEEASVRSLVEEHLARTGSPLAGALLETWPEARRRFRHVIPRELHAGRERARDVEPPLFRPAKESSEVAYLVS
jgi:glutamate synthase domain-containing protein 3